MYRPVRQPAQFNAATDAGPERALLATVLFSAASDFFSRDVYDRGRAACWFASRETGYAPGFVSFEFCCDVFGLDSNRIRQALANPETARTVRKFNQFHK